MSGVPLSPDQSSSKVNNVQVCMAVGSYTGTGGASLAITGLGFRPAFVICLRRTNNIDDGNFFWGTTDSLPNVFTIGPGGSFRWAADFIISFDADGFTVGDSTGFPWGNSSNVTDEIYTWLAWG